METHVFAVWDFMSLAKRLQQDLTNLNLPWVPGKDASLARFINEIIFVEESDEGVDGVPKSHMELYLEAMDEVGASTKQFEGFLSALASGKSVEDALAISEVDPHVTAFIGETMRAALTGSTVEVCASFLYGREDLIPDMFTRFLQARHDKDDYPLFQYYLRRHIEVDGDNHGPAARRMLEKLVDGEMGQWRKAAEAAQRALEARIGLWDGVMRILHRPTPSISFTLHK